MHYPDCNGTYDWSLLLTASDKSGAQSLYGAPGGSTGGDTGGFGETDPTLVMELTLAWLRRTN